MTDLFKTYTTQQAKADSDIALSLYRVAKALLEALKQSYDSEN